MKQAKRTSRSGLTRRQFDRQARRKSDPVYGSFSKRQGYAIAILVILALGIPFGVWTVTGPLFHSYQASAGPKDPETLIWSASTPNNDLSGYNTYCGMNGGKCVWKTNCYSTFDCLDLGSDSSITSVAITKAPVGDLSVASGKELFIVNDFLSTSSTVGANAEWGVFLTTNNTAPTHDIGSSSAYTPKDDPSTGFISDYFCNASCGVAGSTVIENNLYMLRSNSKDTIANQDSGCNAGSVFLCASGAWNIGTNAYNNQIHLNYTGSTNTIASGCSPTGAGCSYATKNGNSQNFPWFTLNQQYYVGFFVKPGLTAEIYFGVQKGTTSYPNRISTFVQPVSSTLPTIDTGGFFGPIIKAFISLGVFIGQNLISFGLFLSSVFAPILSAVIGLFGAVFTAVFNAIGSIFGDGSFGSQISAFFSNLSSYLANVFGTAIATIGSLVTYLSNAISVLGVFVNAGNNFVVVWQDFLSAMAGAVAQLNTFLGLLLYWYTLGVFGFNVILIMLTFMFCAAAFMDYAKGEDPIALMVALCSAFFLFFILQSNVSSINIIAGNGTILTDYQTAWTNTSFMLKLIPIVFFSMLFNWMETLGEGHGFHGRESKFMPYTRSLLSFYQLLTVDIVKAGYWFFKESFDIVSKAIAALKGRWSPVEVVGTG